MTTAVATRVPFLRSPWAVPAVVTAAVAGAFFAQPLLASAVDGELPAVTPEQLLTQVLESEPVPMSGTVVHTARLGLPELPINETSGADPLSLLGGSSTLRLWTDGADRSRVALLGMASEYSVVTDGAEAWTYSSSDDEVVHYALSAADQARLDALRAAGGDGALPGTRDLPTPDEAARSVLAKADESSTVTLGDQVTVAGRDAYQLVVTPDTGGTLVDRVVVAIDGKTMVPLRVQAWSTQDEAAPALEIGFTDISFATPADSVLAFAAPAGAAVREVLVPLPTASDLLAGDGTTPPADAKDHVTVSGTGWETVVEGKFDVAALVAGDPSALAGVTPEKIIGSDGAQDLVKEFVPDHDGFSLDSLALYEQLTTEVPEGRLLSSTLLSILVTDDGRVLVGAVPAETLRAMA